MKDNELIVMLERYQQETNETWGEIATRLGVTAATVSNWKNGTPISLKNRNAIIVLAGKFAGEGERLCYLDKCPATPPPDRQLQIILECWNDLDFDARGSLSSLALKLSAEQHEKFTTRNSNSSNCKAG